MYIFFLQHKGKVMLLGSLLGKQDLQENSGKQQSERNFFFQFLT